MRPCTVTTTTTSSSSNGNVCFPNSSKSLNFSTRPGFGTVGTKCIVKANHFFAHLPDKDLNQYDVTITPEVSSRTVNKSIIAELVRLYKDSDLGMRLPAYDGRKSLYTARQLPFSWKDFMIKLVDQRDILQTVQHNAYDQDPYAKEFRINISEKPAYVEARNLPAPWLKYHESGKEKNWLPHVGQWNMMNKKMINGMTVDRWACINFSRGFQDSVARTFCNDLAHMCQISSM